MEEAELLEKCNTIEERINIRLGNIPYMSGGISALTGYGTDSATGCIERGSVINLAGRKTTLYCQGNGSDVGHALQERDRTFFRRLKLLLHSDDKMLRFTENGGAVITVYSARHAGDLLHDSEIIEGVTIVPDAWKYYLVNNEDAYSLNSRKVPMRGILIPGMARSDFLTGEITGFDSLKPIHFPGDE